MEGERSKSPETRAVGLAAKDMGSLLGMFGQMGQDTPFMGRKLSGARRRLYERLSSDPGALNAIGQGLSLEVAERIAKLPMEEDA